VDGCPLTFLLDDQTGSPELALHEPVRSLLSPCKSCDGTPTLKSQRQGIFAPPPKHCKPCRGTGRRLTTLDAGDVAFSGNGPDGQVLIGIEVKKLPELVGSLDTNRLSAINGQLERMLDLYYQSWVLYHGVYRPDLTTGNLQTPQHVGPGRAGSRDTIWTDLPHRGKPVSCAYVDGFFASPSYTLGGFQSHHSYNIKEAAWWIGVLYHCWNVTWKSHKSRKTIHRPARPQMSFRPTDPLTLRRLVVLSGFPGIGYARAAALLARFRTVRGVMEAGVEEVAEVEVQDEETGRTRRLGAGVAREIQEVLG
jgi:hypothetical protein